MAMREGDFGTAGRSPGSTDEGEELSPARLRSAVARVSRRIRPTAAAGSLTTTEVDMLVVAERHGPARMSDLAVFCGLNPTMVSRLVPRLVELGLLVREADPADKRVCLVEATIPARELLERVRSERDDALSKLLDDLDERERQAIAAATPVLEKLAEALRAQAGTAGPRR
jgi:DNA-binding MarR family transcriptional regulator